LSDELALDLEGAGLTALALDSLHERLRRWTSAATSSTLCRPSWSGCAQTA
jgi:hypothetical protein